MFFLQISSKCLLDNQRPHAFTVKLQNARDRCYHSIFPNIRIQTGVSRSAKERQNKLSCL